MQRREILAEASAIPVIQECLGKRMPAAVRRAIEQYQQQYLATSSAGNQSSFDLEKTALVNTTKR